MSIAVVDGPTVTEFVNDSQSFDKWVEERFETLDTDKNGVLSRHELQERSGRLASKEYELQSKDEIAGLYDALFEKFDADKDGSIDRQEFKTLMTEIMLAKARGLGDLPVSIILQDDSLLMRAVERGLSNKEKK